MPRCQRRGVEQCIERWNLERTPQVNKQLAEELSQIALRIDEKRAALPEDAAHQSVRERLATAVRQIEMACAELLAIA